MGNLDPVLKEFRLDEALARKETKYCKVMGRESSEKEEGMVSWSAWIIKENFLEGEA